MAYNYKQSRKDVLSELTQPTKIVKVVNPTDEKLTYENGKRAWITACFVDIRNSTKLIEAATDTKADDKLARMLRAFSSEIIKIMRTGGNYWQIGLRGDSVYGVFNTPQQSDMAKVFTVASTINTFIKMFNKLLKQNNFQTIKVGIGLGCGNDLIIKAGDDTSGINDILFIGDAVYHAANNADEVANKTIDAPIVMDSCFHFNLTKHKSYKDKNWFTKNTDKRGNEIYSCDVMQSEFKNWINNGFKDSANG